VITAPIIGSSSRLGIQSSSTWGGTMRRILLLLLALLLTLSSVTTASAQPASTTVTPNPQPAPHTAGSTIPATMAVVATPTTVTPMNGSTTTTATAMAAAPPAGSPTRGATGAATATAPPATGAIAPQPSTATATPRATGTTAPTATARATAMGTAKAARAITPNVVMTPNTAIGQQRFQTFVRQRITDRQDFGVNVANGNLIVHGREMNIKGTGLNLAFDRFYNSQSTLTDTLLGTGGTLGTGPDVKVQENADGSVLYLGPSGYQVTFAKSGSTYTTPTGLDATLTKNGDGTFTLAFHASGEKYGFGTSGALTTDTDHNGNVITFAYNADGTVSGITDTQGRAFHFQYGTQDNGQRRLDYISDPNQPGNNVIQYLYFQNRLSGVNNAAGEDTSYFYDGTTGLMTQINDPRGNPIKFTYDASNRVKTITRITDGGAGTGPTTTFTYNSGNTVVNDANNHPTTYTYDGMGRVTQTLDANNHTRGASYNGDSNVLTYTDAATKMWKFTYGANNGESMTQMQLPTGATMKLAYTDTANPYSPTSFTDAQGNLSQYTYDANGNQMSAQNGLTGNNTTHATYNSNGTVHTTTDALGHVTTDGYDTGNKNVTSVTPPAPLGAVGIGYDTDSRITQITDGKGNVVNLNYDASDRVRNQNYVNGPSIAYGFDSNGNATYVNDPNGSQNYTYDPLNRQTQKTFPGSGSPFTYTYDGVGNLLSLQDASGTTNYSYEPTNLLVALFEPGQSGASPHTTFAYDTNGNRTGTTDPNGVTLTEAHDASGRVTSSTGTKGATALTGFSYTYIKGMNDANLRNSMTNTVTGVTTNYSYDAANRLLGAVNPTQNNQYTYDGGGNRLTATLNGTSAFTSPTYNAVNELTAVNGTTLSYDANGNETGRSTGLTAFAYNQANQTTSITPQGGSALSLTYAGQTQSARDTKGGTSYANSLLGVSSETTSGTTTYYVRDNGGKLVGERIGANSYYYLFDGLGSVVALTDGSGTVVDTYSYDPYGKVTPGASNSVTNPWQYTGGYLDSETGLVKLGQRYYDPSTGRWTQLDPLGGGYVYASDNPINFTDPTGLFNGAIFAGGAATAVVGAVAATAGVVLTGSIAAGDPLAPLGPALFNAGATAVIGGIGTAVYGAASN